MTELGHEIQLGRGSDLLIAALDALHRNAAETLPRHTRYEVRMADAGFGTCGVAWYRHPAFDAVPEWHGHGPRPGYYLVGRYFAGDHQSSDKQEG